MTQTQLLNEFRQLSLTEQVQMIQAALRIVAQQVQLVEAPSHKASERQDLKEAAQRLLADYTNDSDLTSFTALDGEPFHV